MPKYDVKTTFPADETVSGNEYTTTKRSVLASDVETPDVVQMYNSYRNSGYKVSTAFSTPKDDVAGDVSPFDVAENLTKQGIDYKASLKIKSKGAYSDMLKAMHLVESSGFDMDVNVKLKINDETSLNIDDSGSWEDEDAEFKINPKASTDNINELKDVYENLDQNGYEVEIDIKPKMPKESDMDSENDSFMSQLSAYPDGSQVTFTLKQDEE